MEAAVVSGILKIVSNKLAPLLFKEYSLIVGVQKLLLDLKDQVQEINCWLEAVGDKVSPNTPGFNWLRKLKDIAYDVDDIVDEFQMNAEEYDVHGVSGAISRYMYKKPKSIILQCKAASKLKAIKKRIDAIVKQRNEFNAIANSLVHGHPARDMSQTSANQTTLPTVDVASVLGRDQEKNQIISKLVYDKHIIKTISIIGLGGSGKTTLAKLVFNDCSVVEKHFEVRLWVHVSQEFDVDKLIKKLFEAFADNNPGQHALPYMIKIISEKLTGKRVLLVLDDVWTESLIQWENFTVHLKCYAPGSRILLTARSRRVAETVQSTDQFDLPLLSLDDSWQLFQQSLVIPAKGLGLEFVKVGKEIVKKGGGVPLAIKALAGVLHGMEQIQEWKSVRDSNVLDVEGKECIVSACLRLSYFHLPSNLKQCFTMCSIFPKGHKIDKEQLIDLWIAHDMITVEDPSDYLNLEYVGHKHFKSLLEVSFLHNVKEEDGRVTYGMHDLVHDLALSILGDEISLDMPNEAISSTTKSYRYFSLIGWPEYMAPKDIFRKARAIYMLEYKDWIYDLERQSSNHYTQQKKDCIYAMTWKHAKHLRSVTVEYLHKERANNISQIKYLKYLAFSEITCETLSEATSDVSSLQALHVRDNFSLRELPQSIGKLKKLRILRLSHCKFLKSLPKSIGDCRMISRIDLCGCNNLTVLPDSIGGNEKLRVLRLSFTKIVRLPSIITTLRNLECLDLHGCRELVDLPEGIGNMEKLQVLNLKDCNKLGGMPLGIGQLSRLQNLGLFVVGKGEKFAGISELADVSGIGGELRIRGISHVSDPNDAHMACLKQKTNLQRLNLEFMVNNEKEVNTKFDWMVNVVGEVDTKLLQNLLDGLQPPPVINGLQGLESFHTDKLYRIWNGVNEVSAKLEQDVLDGLEPPPGIKELEICMYTGRLLARWMQNQVGSGVQGPAPFPFLRVMRLYDFPRLKNLHGLLELPCLEELKLVCMPSLESISGGPFPSLVKLEMDELPCLREVWLVAARTMPDREEEGGCCNLTAQVGQVILVGNCLTVLEARDCPKLEVKPQLPPSLQHLKLWGIQRLLHAPGQRQGSSSSPCFSHLKKLELCEGAKLQSGYYNYNNKHLLQHMTTLELLGELRSLQELTIEACNSLTSLPESMGHLTFLRLLKIVQCKALSQLPDCLGELCSLEELVISECAGIKSLPKGIKDLTALERLWISHCPDLERRCEREMGKDWHLISHIPCVSFDWFLIGFD